MIALILLAAMNATPTPAQPAASTKAATAAPSPTPTAGTGQTALVAAPARESKTGGTRTLADVARERKLGKRPAGGGTLSVSGASAGSPSEKLTAIQVKTAGLEDETTASKASIRNSQAAIDGLWVEKNIHYNEDIKQNARREWDAAAENCRATPGCTPVYRENAQINGVKPLRTGDEVRRDLKSGKDRGGQKLGDGTSW